VIGLELSFVEPLGRLHARPWADVATTIQVSGGSKGGDVIATDGPFAETKEALGGFYRRARPDRHCSPPRSRASARRSARVSSGSPARPTRRRRRDILAALCVPHVTQSRRGELNSELGVARSAG
jgi:hypothetical protein